jgi:hypothetical protein
MKAPAPSELTYCAVAVLCRASNVNLVAFETPVLSS